jgi:prolipoprotein diacylglyceryltransferase
LQKVIPDFFKVDFYNKLIVAILILICFTTLGSFVFCCLDNWNQMSQIKLLKNFNFLGGFIGAIGSGYIYCRYYQLSYLIILDEIGVPVSIGYMFGRFGCHLSGDGDWGIVNLHLPPDWWFLPNHFWVFDYPHNVLKQGTPIPNCALEYCHRLPLGVYPTSLYEAIGGLLIAILLTKYSFKTKSVSLSIFLILMGGFRFVIEFIKINPKHQFICFEFSQAQFLSLVMILTAIILLLKRTNLCNRQLANNLQESHIANRSTPK